MTKLATCKELNYFDHYNILTNIDNRHINNMLNLIDNKTCKLTNKHNSSRYIIIHPCSKQANAIQCSYFDNAGAYSDIVRTNYKEIIKYINPLNYIISEVI